MEHLANATLINNEGRGIATGSTVCSNIHVCIVTNPVNIGAKKFVS